MDTRPWHGQLLAIRWPASRPVFAGAEPVFPADKSHLDRSPAVAARLNFACIPREMAGGRPIALRRCGIIQKSTGGASGRVRKHVQR